MLVPIYQEFEFPIQPTNLTLLPTVEQSVQANPPIYYVEIIPPSNKKGTDINQAAKVKLKQVDNKFRLRVLLQPSIGYGLTACYTAKFYKSTTYSGKLRNLTKPHLTVKPPEKVKLLETQHWFVPNVYKCQPLISTTLIQPNGTDTFNLSNYPEIITISNILDSTQRYKYELTEDLNNTSNAYSISLTLNSTPITPFTIEYYSPTTLEDINFIENSPPNSLPLINGIF